MANRNGSGDISSDQRSNIVRLDTGIVERNAGLEPERVPSLPVDIRHVGPEYLEASRLGAVLNGSRQS
jgi:hypothetical protein